MLKNRLYFNIKRIAKCHAILCMIGIILILTAENLTMNGWSKGLKSKKDGQKLTELNKLYNFPGEFLDDYTESYQESEKNASCVKIPELKNVQINNTYWQNYALSPTNNLHLLSSFYDDRKINSVPIVRVLLMADSKITKKIDLYCQLWSQNSQEPVISLVTEVKLQTWPPRFNKPQTCYGYMLGCPLANDLSVPAAVSLVERSCDQATNILTVERKLPAKGETKKNRFAICCKGSNYYTEDKSIWLVEWLEINFALGFEKVYFYEYFLHPNMTKVVEHYTKLGKLEVRKMTLPGNQPNTPLLNKGFMIDDNMEAKVQNEMLLYNDCFYRNAYLYEYIAIMDHDEILIPTEGSSWQNLMTKIPPDYPGYAFPHFNFLPSMQKKTELYEGVPHYIFTMKNMFRSSKPFRLTYGGGHKSFHSTDQVITVTNHQPWTCRDHKRCKLFYIHPKLAHLHHYRNRCRFEDDSKPKDRALCDVDKVVEEDTCYLSIMDSVISNVTGTLNTLQLI